MIMKINRKKSFFFRKFVVFFTYNYLKEIFLKTLIIFKIMSVIRKNNKLPCLLLYIIIVI